MKSGTCPKCGSNEILPELSLRGGSGHPTYVDIREPEPTPSPSSGCPKANKANLWPMFAVAAATQNITQSITKFWEKAEKRATKVGKNSMPLPQAAC